jgi:hypothetical protein
MKLTLTIDNQLLAKASQLTGIADKTALLRASLEALISSLENKKRVAKQSPIKKPTDSISSQETSLKNTQPPFLAKPIENPLETFQAIMEISRQCAALSIQDSRSEDEILGYNDIGSVAR